MTAHWFGQTAPALLAATLAGTLSLAAPAWAQNAGQSTDQTNTGQTNTGQSETATPPAGAPGADTRGMRSGTHESQTARVEQQIARLHAELKITPAENQQWNAFAGVMRDNAQHMDTLYQERAQHFATMNAVEGLKSYQQIAQAHADDLNKLVPAFQSLYDAMSPEQRSTADQVFRYERERHQQHRSHRG